MSNKNKAIQDIIFYNCLQVRALEINEIRKELNTANLPSFLKEKRQYIEQVFSHKEKIQVLPSAFNGKIVHESQDKDLTETQKKVLSWFCTYVQDLSSEKGDGVL